jgi:hypothetical protein
MKLHIESIEDFLMNTKKENKILIEKLKGCDRTDINDLKNEIKVLKERSKLMQIENNNKQKELNDSIADLKRKLIDYEDIYKNYQNNKLNPITKNNFYYSVNNVSNGNMIMNNNSNGNLKLTENEGNNISTTNHEKFVIFIYLLLFLFF